MNVVAGGSLKLIKRKDQIPEDCFLMDYFDVDNSTSILILKRKKDKILCYLHMDSDKYVENIQVNIYETPRGPYSFKDYYLDTSSTVFILNDEEISRHLVAEFI